MQPAKVHRHQPTAIDRAKTQIIMNHPFYASILLKRPLIETVQIPTAAVNAKGQIYYNPEWFGELTIDEIMFVLCHECMHYMWMHCLRRYHREAKQWNKACDAVINETLKKCGVGSMPAKGIEWPGAEDLSSEQVYDLMTNNSTTTSGGSGGEVSDDSQGPQGQQDGQSDGGNDEGWGIGNDIDESEQLDESERAQIEAEVKVEIQQAANAAKQMGKMPGILERFVEALLEVKTPWYEKLYQFFSRLVEDDFSWERFDRRFLFLDIRLPWFAGQGLNKVVIIVDVSGSISDDELQEFSGHVNTVLEACNPEVCYVVFVHSRVVTSDIREYTPQDFPVDLKCSESGGTDMTKGIDWMMEHHPDADATIVLTDGYTPFGNDPGVPVFWAITTNVQAPWGESVQLEVEGV